MEVRSNRRLPVRYCSLTYTFGGGGSGANEAETGVLSRTEATASLAATVSAGARTIVENAALAQVPATMQHLGGGPDVSFEGCAGVLSWCIVAMSCPTCLVASVDAVA